MADFASLRLRVGLLAGLLLAIGAGAALAQQKVGVSSAVNPQATGTPPGGAPRQLLIGQDVLFNERIATTEAGQTQLLFLDESSMTIGPNSDLTIDRFVYDPRSGTGTLAMSATRGVLRYVGGKLSKQDNAVTLRSSTATLAVRGGAFIGNFQPNGRAEIIFVFGHGVTVTGANGISQTVSRPGFEIIIAGPGAAPSAPTPVPPGQLAQLLAQLDGRRGGSGGATVVPTDATIAQSGVSQTISGDLSNSIQQAQQNQNGGNPGPQPPTFNPAAAQSTTNPQPNSAGQVITCLSQGTCSPGSTIQVATTPSGQPIGGSNSSIGGPVTITFAGRLKNTNGHGTAQGFVDQSARGDIPYTGGTLTFPSGQPQNGVFTANVGSLGTVTFPLTPGTSSFQGSSSSFGTLSGSGFLSSDNTFFYASLTPNSQPGERLFIFGGTPAAPAFYQTTGPGLRPQAGSNTRLFAFGVQPDAALQASMPFVRSQAGGNLPNASVSPFYVVAPPTTAIGDTSTTAGARGLQASLAVNGQGANQQSAISVTAGTIGTQSNGQPIFTGQMRGSSLLSASGTPVRLGSAVSSTVDGSGNSFYGGSTISGFVLDQTAYGSNSNGTVGGAIIPSTASETSLSGTPTQYGFAQPAVPTPVPSGVGVSRTTRALSGNFGGLMYTTAQGAPYMVSGGTLVSTDAPNNRLQAMFTGTPQSPSAGISSVTMQYGGLTGTPGAQAFIDDNTFAAMESPVNPQQIVINGSASQPAGQLYMVTSGAAGAPTSLLPPGASYCQCQFLQWGYWGGDLASLSGGQMRIDRGNINTWVAGVPTSFSDINSLMGQSASATYSGHAIGSVFNNGASYLAAGGFNGTYNFGLQTGTMAINNFDGHSFVASGSAPLNGASYTFTATSPGFKGGVNGTFYGPMAAETGGSFNFQSTLGPTYLASGIYAGKH